jgi:hypothetical protein
MLIQAFLAALVFFEVAGGASKTLASVTIVEEDPET